MFYYSNNNINTKNVLKFDLSINIFIGDAVEEGKKKKTWKEKWSVIKKQWDRVALGFEDEAYLSFFLHFPVLTMHLRYPLFPFSYTVPT